MEFTGERVVLEGMRSGDPDRQAHFDRIITEHITRYEWAAAQCKGKTVLDAASGSGYGTKMLREVAKSAIGVDASEEAVEYSGEGFSVCDLERDFPTGEFDVVVSFETIEHLADPSKFLCNCAQHAKTLLFSIPLNNATEFHLETYTLDEAKYLIGQYFKNVTWYEQTLDRIEPLTKEGRFLVGVAHV